MKRQLANFKAKGYILLESLFSLLLFTTCGLLLFSTAVYYYRTLKQEEQQIDELRQAYEILYLKVNYQQYSDNQYSYDVQGKKQVIRIED